MLAAVPPVIFPMVRTAESRGAIVLEIMVCNSVRMYADVMTGSMLLWGCAPCPPFPRIVSFTVSEEAIKEPRRMPMVPAGMSGQQ